MATSLVSANRFEGLADGYDQNRPTPPTVIVDVLCRYAGTNRPRLVADIGCGTGLFTRRWIGRAEAVVGIEPSRDMRRRAMEATAGLPGGDTVRYREGQAATTGLDAGSVDIATCSQSLHWMEPDSTFAEMARILRPGGVFAAVDVDMTPAFGGPAEEAFLEVRRRTRHLEDTLRPTTVRRWEKAGHLARMAASGRFRVTREITAHMVEPWTGARLVGLALSMGGVAALLAHGCGETDCGLDALRREAEALGPGPIPFHWSYRVRIGLTA